MASLFMVVERFPAAKRAEAAERYARCGRMIPEGVAYVASWMKADGSGCYQLRRGGREARDEWIANWNDLVEFEVEVVVESGEYWERARWRDRGP